MVFSAMGNSLLWIPSVTPVTMCFPVLLDKIATKIATWIPLRCSGRCCTPCAHNVPIRTGTHTAPP